MLWALVSLSLTAAPLPAIAVTRFHLVQVDPELGGYAEDRLASALSERGFKVTTPADLQTMLGLERQRQLLGCSDDSAGRAEISSALGVPLVASGRLTRLGGRFEIDVRVINQKDARVVANVTRTTTDDAPLPNSADVFLEIPPDGGMPRLRDAGIADSGLAPPWFEGGVVTRAGTVLLAPSRGAAPAVYEPGAGVLTLLDAGAQVTGGPQFSGAVLLKDGESALMVPTENEQVLWVSTTSASPQAALSKLAGGVLLPSGDVLMTPRYQTRFARVSGASLTFPGPASTSAYFSAAWSTNGYAYAVQTDGLVGHVAIIDRLGNVEEQLFNNPNVTASSHYGFVTMGDGTIVGCPFQSKKVMLLIPNDRRTVSLRTMTSPWLDKW